MRPQYPSRIVDELHDLIASAARERHCVFVAGLPASGKSAVVRRIGRAAADAGRVVHLLQWDVARLPFDTPANLARYPELGGVTHAAIRLAVGRWARGAVLRWDRAHPGPRHILVGETPLIGERLMELARPRDDGLEPLLAGERTLFVVPVPSAAVRRAIEAARAGDMSAARDAKSAPPDLVRAHWSEIEAVAVALGLPRASGSAGYDPGLYAATYQRLLRHRHVVVAPVTDVAWTDAALAGVHEIVPSADEVAATMREIERMPSAEVARSAAQWYAE